MAFTLSERDGFSWLTTDKLPHKHLFTRRMTGVGEHVFFDPPVLPGERLDAFRRAEARWLAFRDLGDFPEAGFAVTHQVHGTVVRYVTEDDLMLPPTTDTPMDCDGLITDRPGVPLGVFSADCVPVLFSEPEAGLVCAVHSGWKGTVKDMMGAAVAAITERGGEVANIYAAIGPCISRCCFETGPEVPAAVEALLGADAVGTFEPEEGVEGKFLVDLKETNRRRLLQLGVPADHIDVSEDCTKCMCDVYWSHRATGGRRGSMVSVIML